MLKGAIVGMSIRRQQEAKKKKQQQILAEKDK